MRRTVSLSEFMPYGAPELLAAHRPHLVLALAVSSAIAVMVFATALRISPLFHAPRILEDVGVILVPPLQPPSIRAMESPPPKVAPARVHARIDDGVIVPAPPEDAPPYEPLTDAGGVGEGAIGPGPDLSAHAGAASGSSVEPLPARGVFVPVDELPVLVRDYKPEYPPIAREAGVEGLVIVHALIGKDGRVLRVELDEKAAIPLLNEAALEGAKRWVFTPAIANGHAIPFWYAVPFRFILRE